MADEMREPKRKGRSRRQWLPAAAVTLLLLGLLVGVSCQYISYVSQTVYQESTSHLEEVLHKSNNMLKELVRKNLTYLHLYNGFLENTSDEGEIQAYVEKAQQDTGFADFYFLSYDGNYMTVSGKTGYLGLQTNLDEKLSDGEDIVMNAVLPGKPQMLVFICPETQGSYRNFDYDAIAIAYYNDAVLKALDNSAFQGSASNYVVYSDGRVVIDNSVNATEPVYNFIAVLRDHSDLSEEQILALSDAFEQGSSGNMKVKLGDTSYYLVYEGTAVQSWTMLGLVPVKVVNANLDKLWFRTVQIVTGIALCLAATVILLLLRKSHDTLRRKNTEILYRDELFQKLSLNVDDVFLMLDAKTSKVDYVSPNIERLLGVSEGEVRQNIHVLDKLHPKNAPKNDKNCLDGLRSGGQREWDFEYLHQQTGEQRWFHIIAMGSEVEGRAKYILVMSDRTADKQVNQALSDAVAAAETANRAKSTFLSNMSHDIRTPMNAIIGFTTLAVSNIDDKERVKDYLAKTLASSKHLLSLINDVLDMSKLEAGQMVMEQEPFDIEVLLHDVSSLVEAQIEKDGLTHRRHRENIQHTALVGSSLKLRQIMVNLFSNAIKYNKPGGSIDTYARELSCNGTTVWYEFRITDTGIGMSRDFVENQLFKPFTQESADARTQYRGTGLGMSIVKELVSQMGGSISAESQLGEGTAFTFQLPFLLDKNAAAKPQLKPTDNGRLDGMHILLVEDNDINMEVAEFQLTSQGAAVDKAWNGREAVERFATSAPGGYQAILMDVMMPVMDGFEASRAIRALDRPDAATVPILAMTAQASDECAQSCHQVGMNGRLVKPLDAKKLAKSIREAVQNKQ